MKDPNSTGISLSDRKKVLIDLDVDVDLDYDSDILAPTTLPAVGLRADPNSFVALSARKRFRLKSPSTSSAASKSDRTRSLTILNVFTVRQ